MHDECFGMGLLHPVDQAIVLVLAAPGYGEQAGGLVGDQESVVGV